MKRNSKPRRTRPRPASVELAATYERLCAGEPLNSRDRRMLQAIVLDIMFDVDPRERFYEVVAGSPEPAHHRVWVALDVHLQPDFATAPKQARGRVADAWGIPEETVRTMEREARSTCAEALAKKWVRAGIKNIVAQQRARWLKRDVS